MSKYRVMMHYSDGTSEMEDEIFENVYHKLYKYEKIILTKTSDYEQLLTDSFILIDEKGHVNAKAAFLKGRSSEAKHFNSFKMLSISQKTKLITYELDSYRHTSLWRRHERWQIIYHQVSPIL